MDSLPDIPCLEIKGDVMNGMIPVCWTNFDEYHLIMEGCKITHNAYTEWRVTEIGTWIDECYYIETFGFDEFFIKVPMLFHPYELSLTFTVVIRHIDEESGSEITEDSSEVSERKFVESELVSKIYKIQIPSFMKQPRFEKNERIKFYPPNSGVIINILPNGQLVIKIEARSRFARRSRACRVSDGRGPGRYQLQDDGAYIFTLDRSELMRLATDKFDIADLTDQRAIESDMILKTNDKQKYKMYVALWHEIKNFCDRTMFELRAAIATVITCNVYKYLCNADYEYRFDCLLCHGHLHLEQQWKYVVRGTLTEYETQDFVYRCDLCRKEIDMFDYVYRCESNESEHTFCISCMHSVSLQYNQMMPFMMKLLNNVLNGNCIEEIVTFCVSKAIKFDQDFIDDDETLND